MVKEKETEMNLPNYLHTSVCLLTYIISSSNDPSSLSAMAPAACILHFLALHYRPHAETVSLKEQLLLANLG
jgi:hypothetical protein